MKIPSAEEQQAMLRAICRQNLGAFTQKAFGLISPGSRYQHNWHIDALTWHLQQVIEGRMRRLIITLPPRSMKSICVSSALPAFVLGKNPSARIIAVSYSQDLADKHARDCKALMESAFYKTLFPGAVLDPRKSSVAEFTTRGRGFRLATSLGGTLTGRGGDLIILDDPMKPEDALSEAVRAKGLDWFSNTLLSRLDDKENGAIILVMQRLHEEDLAGHLLAQNGSAGDKTWHHLNLPAICEETQSVLIGPGQVYTRSRGEALHPGREPTPALERLKTEMGAYDFAAQYQQNPAPRGGGLIKTNWFQYYETPFSIEDGDIIVQSWDTAMSNSSKADYSVCTSWAIRKIGKIYNYYLLHVFRKQIGFPELQRQIRALAKEYSPSHILVENKGSGISLIQDLKSQSLLPVKAITPSLDKLTRMHIATPPIENGRVFLPKHASWMDGFSLELSRFPRAKHDDQVDSTSQFINWAEAKFANFNDMPMGFIV